MWPDEEVHQFYANLRDKLRGTLDDGEPNAQYTALVEKLIRGLDREEKQYQRLPADERIDRWDEINDYVSAHPDWL